MNIEQSVQPEKREPSLRADIDGLRAIAILVVVLYHAKFSDWSGGFVGVDVFFVISGYLIIPKIAQSRFENRFVLSEFFAGRVRRLIPALVPVLFVSFLLAFFLLGPDALESFSQSFLAAGTFVSNYVFLAQSGYFQRSSEDLLLLHTWSLAIEFQFYIITPLIFLLMDKRLNMKFVLMVLGAASLVVSIVLVGQGNDWAFYGIIPRFWELAFGGILGLIAWNFPFPRYVGFLFRLLGIFAIIAAATQYTTAIPFPGIAAILPAAGAALILVAPSNSKDPLFRFLSSTGMRWLGLRSYSIYCGIGHLSFPYTWPQIRPRSEPLCSQFYSVS